MPKICVEFVAEFGTEATEENLAGLISRQLESLLVGQPTEERLSRLLALHRVLRVVLPLMVTEYAAKEGLKMAVEEALGRKITPGMERDLEAITSASILPPLADKS